MADCSDVDLIHGIWSIQLILDCTPQYRVIVVVVVSMEVVYPTRKGNHALIFTANSVTAKSTLFATAVLGDI